VIFASYGAVLAVTYQDHGTGQRGPAAVRLAVSLQGGESAGRSG
jgi:hypothetical protein